MKTTSDILQAARQRLITNGWRKDSMGAENGPHCAMGAIYWEKDNLSKRTEVYSYIEHLVPRGYIGEWNDRPERTFEEVLEVFDNAISLAMSEEHAPF